MIGRDDGVDGVAAAADGLRRPGELRLQHFGELGNRELPGRHHWRPVRFLGHCWRKRGRWIGEMQEVVEMPT